MLKQVEGFENYEISSEGFVRNSKTGRVLKFDNSKCEGSNPYYRVTLSKGSKTFKFAIHRLVAFHFVEGFAEGLEVNHKDGDRTNNDYTNLEWMTPEENRNHCEENNLNPKGSSHGNSKYTEEQVQLVRELSERGLSRKDCAVQAHVTVSFVKDVRAGRAWKHI